MSAAECRGPSWFEALVALMPLNDGDEIRKFRSRVRKVAKRRGAAALRARDSEDRPLLWFAVQRNDPIACELLLAHGAGPSAFAAVKGRTAYQLAYDLGHDRALRVLRSWRPRTNALSTDLVDLMADDAPVTRSCDVCDDDCRDDCVRGCGFPQQTPSDAAAAADDDDDTLFCSRRAPARNKGTDRRKADDHHDRHDADRQAAHARRHATTGRHVHRDDRDQDQDQDQDDDDDDEEEEEDDDSEDLPATTQRRRSSQVRGAKVEEPARAL